MTSPLSDVLEDLAGQVGPADLAPGLAARAWARGRRRQIRARASRAGGAVLAVAAVALAVLPARSALPEPPAASPGSPAVGYPQRIAKPWHIGDLPAHGAPLAAVVFGSHQPGSWDGWWYAVAQDGGLSHLPVATSFLDAVVPSLSADGRLLGYRDQRSGHYVIRDVVSGQVTAFPRVVGQDIYQGSTVPDDAPYTAAVQSPGFFSPDGQHLAITGTNPGGPGGTTATLVLGRDGSVQPLATGKPFTLAGWLDSDTMLGLESREQGPDEARTTVITPVALAVDGGAHPLPALRPDHALSAFDVNQWSPSLSPDHLTLLLAYGPRDGADAATSGTEVLGFDLTTGQQNSTTAAHGDVPMPGSPMALAGSTHTEWRRSQWFGNRPGEGVTEVSPGLIGGQPTIVVDPRLNLGWLDLADQALSGPAHTTLWGTHESWASWHWRELLLAAAGLGAFWLLRRRMRRSPSQPARGA